MVYALVTTLLAAFALGGAVAGGLLLIGVAAPSTRARLAEIFAGQERHPIAWAWVIALLATAGSLYLSEIAGLAPCLFCWLQRIFMYPLVLVLGVGALRADAGVWRYGLPLAVVGIGLSMYHVWIQFRPAGEPGVCSGGVPCSARYLSVFGFVSIPMMAGAAFLIVIALLLLVRAASDRP